MGSSSSRGLGSGVSELTESVVDHLIDINPL